MPPVRAVRMQPHPTAAALGEHFLDFGRVRELFLSTTPTGQRRQFFFQSIEGVAHFNPSLSSNASILA
jgi:hypothetical protein